MSINAQIQGASNTMAKAKGETASKKNSSVPGPISAHALFRTVTMGIHKKKISLICLMFTPCPLSLFLIADSDEGGKFLSAQINACNPDISSGIISGGRPDGWNRKEGRIFIKYEFKNEVENT
jgi:hypothetical protein